MDGGVCVNRIAVDIGLPSTKLEKPKTERQDRELMNRLRLWMICFDTDWAMAAHWYVSECLRM